VDPDYFTDLGPDEVAEEIFDGHHGNSPGDIGNDDNATDILLIEGDKYTDKDDIIELSQDAAGLLVVDYNGQIIKARWRGDDPDDPETFNKPLVEQFRVSGLMGDDVIGFVEGEMPWMFQILLPAATTG
jgi:hypothetical protein